MIWLWAVLQALTLIGVASYWRNLPIERKEETPDGVVVILSLRDDWDGAPDLIARLQAQHARFRHRCRRRGRRRTGQPGAVTQGEIGRQDHQRQDEA